jgi:nitroreductase
MNIDDLFLNHRNCYDFADTKIPDGLLQKIYDVSKYGSTSFNSLPLRIIFVQSNEQKANLLKCLTPGNVAKTKSAPVTAIFAYDLNFYENLPQLFPPMPTAADLFIGKEQIILDTALRNSSLQAAYFMLVARSYNLACGAMSGFDTNMINNEFFQNSSWKTNFLCNLGYKKEGSSYQTMPRLEFDKACKFV